MIQAIMVSSRSTCNRANVGAVIIKDNREISTGYNGSPAGLPHCDDKGHDLLNGHCVRTVHAEANAILQCAKTGISSNGAILYVTHFPCKDCTKLIIQAGISKVYYFYEYRKDPRAIEWFSEAHIEVKHLDYSTDISDRLEKLSNDIRLDTK